VAQFLIRLRQLLRWLEISDADMERGQLRCDANVSIREPGSQELNPKTEIKNVNSIANIRQAVQAEIERQIREVEAGRTIESWTLDWDDERGVLSKLRSKETEADYRYFRDPDLLPIRIEEAEKQAVRQALPELPLARRGRLVQAYGLPEYDAEILTEERTLSDFFETSVSAYGGDPKRVSNWVMNEVLRLIRQTGTTAGELGLKPTHLAEIIQLVDSGMITAGVGKGLLEKARGTERSPRQIVEEQGLIQVTDSRLLREAANRILQANPDQVGSYRAGKVTILGWFVGQLMRETGGRADAKKARELLQELLEG
jgi:aspartyl-tRNA(Asn)/glutamyl-tRNA(Gln) amidotransferase subunit B